MEMFNSMKDLYFNEHILSNKLIEKIKDSDSFKEFVSIYNNKETITKDMSEIVRKLLKEEFDLYALFLKINCFLYRYDSSKLNNKLQDYHRHTFNDVEYIITIDDVAIITYFYLRHKFIIKLFIKFIINNRLRPNNEIVILKNILNRQQQDELLTYLYSKTDDL